MQGRQQKKKRKMTTERTPACNSGLAKVAVSFSADTFVVTESSVLRINICGKNRHLRQAAKRYASPVLQRSSYVSLIAALSPFFM